MISSTRLKVLMTMILILMTMVILTTSMSNNTESTIEKVEKVKSVEIALIKQPIELGLVKSTIIPTKSIESIKSKETNESNVTSKSAKSKKSRVVTKLNKKTKKTTFRVTAYCACKKCCGKWSDNRPLDKNGKPIVYGASGEKLINNYSCASPLPFGTKVKLDGIGTVEVHDRTAKWVVNKYGNNIIDIYMTNHNEAYNFMKYVEGEIYND